MDSNIFSFFDSIYCINMISSAQRRLNILNEFKRVGLLNDVTFINGIEPDDSINDNVMIRKRCCMLSHMLALHSSITNGGSVLIFEDDIQFLDHTIDTLERGIIELPTDWDVLYLFGKPYSNQIKYSKTLVKPVNLHTSSAYAISNNNIKWELINKISQVLIDGQSSEIYSGILKRFGESHNSFCVFPIVATVVDDIKSEITGKLNYGNHQKASKVVENLWKKNKPIDY